MLKNYIVIALRSMTHNRLYSAINIGGLAVALVVYLLSQIIADHERSFDSFFPDADRVYAISADFQPGSDVGVNATSAVPMVVGPLLREQMPEAELIARMFTREVLTRNGDNKFYQSVRFVEPGFIEIFAFDYIRGAAASALADPSGLIITATTAKKYFGDANPMGSVLTMGAGKDLRVTAVIAEVQGKRTVHETEIREAQVAIRECDEILQRLQTKLPLLKPKISQSELVKQYQQSSLLVRSS